MEQEEGGGRNEGRKKGGTARRGQKKTETSRDEVRKKGGENSLQNANQITKRESKREGPQHSARQLGWVTEIGARNPRSTCCEKKGMARGTFASDSFDILCVGCAFSNSRIPPA